MNAKVFSWARVAPTGAAEQATAVDGADRVGARPPPRTFFRLSGAAQTAPSARP
jgi:hypothetical protein